MRYLTKIVDFEAVEEAQRILSAYFRITRLPVTLEELKSSYIKEVEWMREDLLHGHHFREVQKAHAELQKKYYWLCGLYEANNAIVLQGPEYQTEKSDGDGKGVPFRFLGLGLNPLQKVQSCAACSRKGWVKYEYCFFCNDLGVTLPCRLCKGQKYYFPQGKDNAKRCTMCTGTGLDPDPYARISKAVACEYCTALGPEKKLGWPARRYFICKACDGFGERFVEDIIPLSIQHPRLLSTAN